MDFTSLTNAPILCSITRGKAQGKDIIECCHRGLIAVTDGEANTIFSVGDVTLPVHIRSTAKPFQLMPLLEEEQGKLDKKDLALLMSSHSGDRMHTERVAEILHNFGFTKDDLRCGIHVPYSLQAQLELLNQHALPNTLHNNCSGKHTAMLLLCKKLGKDYGSYEMFSHHVQEKIRNSLGLFSGEDPATLPHGIDGCSMPSYCVPLHSLALAYARLSYWQDYGDKPYLKELWEGATEYPEFVAGVGRYDTELMQAAKGQIFCKTGADGMQALAIKADAQFPKGLGIAIKIVDGDQRNTIRPFIVKTLLERFNKWPSEPKLDKFLPPSTNMRGLETGSVIASF